MGSLLDEAGIKGRPSRMFLVAHPHENGNGLACSDVRLGRIVLIPWWGDVASDGRFNLVYAHVCDGARLLSRPLWRGMFPEWVSFDGPVFAVVGTPRGAALWTRTIDRIGKELERRQNAQTLLLAVKDSLLRGMIEMAETYKPDEADVVNLMYLQQCLNNVTHSAGAEE
jgi:hypothetical protein